MLNKVALLDYNPVKRYPRRGLFGLLYLILGVGFFALAQTNLVVESGRYALYITLIVLFILLIILFDEGAIDKATIKNHQKKAFEVIVNFLIIVYNDFSKEGKFASINDLYDMYLFTDDIALNDFANPVLSKKHFFKIVEFCITDLGAGLQLIKDFGEIKALDNLKQLVKLKNIPS